MNTLFFGKDKEERKEMIIALLVIAFFGWLGYKMGWLGLEDEVSPQAVIEQAQVSSLPDTDKDGISNRDDACPLVVGIALHNGCPRKDDIAKKVNVKSVKGDAKTQVGTAINQPQCSETGINCSVDKDKTISAIKAAPAAIAVDSDNDTFLDAVDDCPTVAGTVRGCPLDTDGDGVIDDQDQCIDAPGLAQNIGCPLDTDQDKDGVKDADDVCPSKPGTLENNGCPLDLDGDGIVDKDDTCPNKEGTVENNGCPMDSDSDGIADAEDKCPTLAGTVENNGCPLDSDDDGIADTEDKCPNKNGIADNDGCPEVEITQEDRKVLEEALTSVAFISGSSELTKYSKTILNKVSALLSRSPNYSLLIKGHTDSTGNDALNFSLSEDRALSVYKYLASQGISKGRMSHSGFGEKKPIASNKTRKGRLKNRRVEFKLY